MLALLASLLIQAQPLRGNVPDLLKVVVYEANLRALGPHPGFRGLTDRLNQIQALGVNVLWLMPIQPVGKVRSAGGLGSPYAIRDFRAVNPEFGDAQELTALIKAAHRLKIAVILDWVADHTSWDSDWLTRHPDWYLRDNKGQIESPPGTGWNDVAALDFGNKAMRSQMIADMGYWIARFDFDGFRCDSADRMPFDFWKTAIESVRAGAKKRLLMLAEGHRTDDYAAGFDLTYGWSFSNRLREIFRGRSAADLAAASTDETGNLPLGARRLNFITNHDVSAWEGSLIEYYKSEQGVMAAFTVAALYGGTPLIYTGQEVGYEKRIPIFEHTAIDWSKNPTSAGWMSRLVAIRNSHPAFLAGTLSDRSTKDIVMFSRRKNSDEVLVIANSRDRAESIHIDGAWQGEWNNGFSGKAEHLGPDFPMPSFGSLVLTRKAP